MQRKPEATPEIAETINFRKFEQRGNRLKREITPIKHRTLRLSEILELEAVSKNTNVLG
jgi:hypothetical protein